MDYGRLVTRPFEVIARRPYLWLLGLLAGGGAAANSGGGGSSYQQQAGTNYRGPSAETLQAVWNNNWEWMVGVAAFLALIGVVLFVLGCIATGGIIHAAVEHDQGREYRLGVAWRAGYSTGWRIAGLRLLTFLLGVVPALLFGSLAIVAVAAAFNSAPVVAVAFGMLAALVGLVAIAFWIALGVAYEFAQRIVVLEAGHVAESLTAGFRMLVGHFKESAIGWLLLIALSIAGGIAMAVIAVVAVIPAGGLGFLGWALGGGTGLIVLGTFAAVFFLGVVLAAGGAYSAYMSVYWTLLFRDIRALPAPAAGQAIVPAS